MSLVHPDIVACPSCLGCVSIDAPALGTASPKTFWTDGFDTNPLYYPESVVFHCPHCQTPQMRDRARSVRSIRKNATNPHSDPSTKQALAPSFEDCLLILKSNNFSPEEEINIRVEAWQICNHRRRDTADPIEYELLEIENLTALRLLLEKEGGEVSHILAEVLRELGHHAACQDLLDTLLVQSKHPFFLRLVELNRMKDRFVARVFKDS